MDNLLSGLTKRRLKESIKLNGITPERLAGAITFVHTPFYI